MQNLLEQVNVAESVKDSERKPWNSNLMKALSDEGIEVKIIENDELNAKACFSWWTRSWSCSSSKCKFAS